MTSFHESIKELISEVEKFLVETIKKEALSKTSKEHKQTILDKIGRLREEFPQFTPDKQSEDTKSADQSFTDESSRTGGSSNADDEDQYGDSNIPAIPAQDLTDTIKCGFLEKKQRKGGLFGGPKLQKRWCAIKHNIFYYYESAKERKQHGAFYLNGYYLEAAPEAVDKKDSARRELSFQLVCPAKRTYQFVALSKEDYDDWKVAISKGALSSSSRENNLNDDEPGEVYEDVGAGDDAVVEEVYDDTLDEPEPSPKPVVKALPSIPRPPPPSIPTEPTCDEIYDDTANPDDDIQEEYDDCVTAVPPPPPPTPGRSLPEIPGSRKPLPSVPPTPPPSIPKPLPNIPPPEVPKESKPDASSEPQIPPDQDYENMFLGKWNCKADRSNELGFNKGDKLYIISREFDDKSWWVAELHGKFGLVPKNYLTPAYELAR